MGEKVNEGRPVVREFVPDSLAGERVDRVVSFITGASRSMVSKCIHDGEVLCNDAVVRKGSQKVTSGDLIVVNSALFDSGLESKQIRKSLFQLFMKIKISLSWTSLQV